MLHLGSNAEGSFDALLRLGGAEGSVGAQVRGVQNGLVCVCGLVRTRLVGLVRTRLVGLRIARHASCACVMCFVFQMFI